MTSKKKKQPRQLNRWTPCRPLFWDRFLPLASLLNEKLLLCLGRDVFHTSPPDVVREKEKPSKEVSTKVEFSCGWLGREKLSPFNFHADVALSPPLHVFSSFSLLIMVDMELLWSRR